MISLEYTSDILRYSILCLFKYKSSKLKSKYPRITKKVIEYTDFLDDDKLYGLGLKERSVYILLRIYSKKLCKTCNINQVKLKSNKYPFSFSEYCSIKCCSSNPEIIKQKEITAISNFGGVGWASKKIQDKIENHYVENYGVYHNSQLPDFSKKAKATKLERYGDENFVNVEKAKATKLERYGDENYSNRYKAKQTCLARFGHEHNWSSPILRKTAFINTLGVENPSQSLIIKEKKKKTFIIKYNVENPWQTNEVKEQIKLTKLERYGDENYNNIEQQKITTRINYHTKFIDNSNNLHDNKYQYNMLLKSQDNIEINCPIHGIFLQRMDVHMRGSGCQKCALSNFSKVAIEWLEHISKEKDIYIQHAMNEGEYKVPNTRYHVDGYCKETNTIYEFLGDYWHGNPEKYLAEDINPTTKEKYGDSYDDTIKRFTELTNLDYNVISIWENEWNKFKK